MARPGLRCAWVRPLLLSAAACFPNAGCSGDAPGGWSADTPAAFTVLGRWGGNREIVYSVAVQPGDPHLKAATAAAVGEWAATGIFTFREAGDGEAADLVFSFESGAHGPCVPFNYDEGMAHAGPPVPPTYVHFDRARDWSETGYSLAQAAAHELGHVLGIGHTDDEGALMYPVPDATRTRLNATDLAALHSLYSSLQPPGGAAPSSADLVIHRDGDEAARVALFGVTPEATTDFTAVDTDGDGDDEVLVWRTDRAGYGSLMIFDFGPGPELRATQGPLPGVALPEKPHVAGITQSGERVFVSLLPDGRWLARAFDVDGLPQVRPPGPPLRLEPWLDTDGDGSWDEPHPDPVSFEPASALRVDLDGDGTFETIHRRSGH